MSVARQAHAAGGADALTIQVTGSALSNITSSALSLSPTFAPTITDYAWRCHTGINPVQLVLTAVSGGTVVVGGRTGHSLVLEESILENQALIVSAPDPNNGSGPPVRYWIRCLPHDFPQLSVAETRMPPLGWYLTGNVNSASGSGAYAMVLDSHGTPVWYQWSGISALNVTLLDDGTIAWMSGSDFGTFEDYNLSTQAIGWLANPGPSQDFHELLPMATGDRMTLFTPFKQNVDMSSFGGSPNATVIDCVIEEVDPKGQLVWQWRASDHISVAESTHPLTMHLQGQVVYDVYHCNSIDTDAATGDVLLSARHTDSVYLISKSTGTTMWKMGGTSYNYDGAQILQIAGDPEGVFHAQHDARFEPNGDISLYDNQSWDTTLAARGVEYHIDTAAGIASLVWSYQAPDGQGSLATGSFRRLYAGTDNVIGWGVKTNTLFTEVDQAGNVMLNVTFPNGEFAYRVQKVSLTALDHDLLRATAGLLPFSIAPDTDPVITAAGTTVTAKEDTAFTNTVATFNDPDPTATANAFLATIAWGDGSSSPGNISGATGGPFSVTGSHTYAGPGTNVTTVYITRVGAAAVKATATSTINVADAALSATCAMPATSLTLVNATVATFADADPSGSVSNHRAIIAWGDGSSSPGVVSGPDGGPFVVNATHTYGSTGRFNITTTINDVAGASSSASCSSLIYAFPQGAVAVAMGEKNTANGAPITFRLVPSSKLDSSDDLVPARFKELWPKLAPTCGIDWATIIGNGSTSVRRALPDYMGVIVISAVKKGTPAGSGITAHIVVVKTNAAQRREPGDWADPGRGTVEAQIC